MDAPLKRMAPVGRRVKARDEVEDGGLAGAVGPDEARRSRRRSTVRSNRLTAVSPPKRLLSPRTSSSVTPDARRAAPDQPMRPLRQERDDQDEDQPVEHDVGARPAAERRARELGDRREDEGAEQRARARCPAPPTMAGSSPWIEMAGPKVMAGVDVGEVLRVEGAAQRGEEGRHGHGAELGAERVHPRRLRRVLVLADRGQRDSRAASARPPRDRAARPAPSPRIT